MNNGRAGLPNAADLLALTGQAAYEWDLSSDLIEWSEDFGALAGLDAKSSWKSGRDFDAMVSSASGQSRRAAVFSGQSTPAGDGSNRFQCVYAIHERHVLEGGPVWLEDTGAWVADETGKPGRVMGVVRVINERRKREDQLRRQSDFDDLTGLPNRRYMEFRLGQTIDECMRNGEQAALIVVGIDRMDLINDFYGFPVGDEVLRKAGAMLAKTLRSDDLIARFSGAKFAVLAKNVSGSDLYTASRRYIDVLSRNMIKTSGGPVALNPIIGACQLPRHARSVSEAVGACFSAAQQASRDKHGRIAIYDPSPERQARSRAEAKLAANIVKMLDKDRLRLAYQPIVAADSGKIAFHEALLRMEGDDGKILGAGSFLPLAEQLGFMRIIDSRVIDLSMDILCTYGSAKLSINVSHATAEDPDWISRLLARLQSAPDVAKRLIIEITESHAASDLKTARKFVSLLKELGCRIAVDDFGAGYTSFANLRSLPVDIIKIDGTFARDIASNQQNQIFIRSLLELARAFEVQTVVEWVENEETARLLAEWGVDYLQGHCFGPASIANPWTEAEESAVPRLAVAS